MLSDIGKNLIAIIMILGMILGNTLMIIMMMIPWIFEQLYKRKKEENYNNPSIWKVIIILLLENVLLYAAAFLEIVAKWFNKEIHIDVEGVD